LHMMSENQYAWLSDGCPSEMKQSGGRSFIACMEEDFKRLTADDPAVRQNACRKSEIEKGD